jgi:hypothetical protein
LDYQNRDAARPPRSAGRRLVFSALIGLGGGVLNLAFLVVANDTNLIPPFLLVSGPATLALFGMDRFLGFHAPRETAWVLLICAAVAQYAVYGLLLNFRFPLRKAVLLLALLFHLASGVFLCLIRFR